MRMQGGFGETWHVQCKGGGRRGGNARRKTRLVGGWRSDLCAGDGGVPDPGCGGDRGRGGHGRSDDDLGVPWVDVKEIWAVFNTSVVFGADPDEDSVGVQREAGRLRSPRSCPGRARGEVDASGDGRGSAEGSGQRGAAAAWDGRVWRGEKVVVEQAGQAYTGADAVRGHGRLGRSERARASMGKRGNGKGACLDRVKDRSAWDEIAYAEDGGGHHTAVVEQHVELRLFAARTQQRESASTSYRWKEWTHCDAERTKQRGGTGRARAMDKGGGWRAKATAAAAGAQKGRHLRMVGVADKKADAAAQPLDPRAMVELAGSWRGGSFRGFVGETVGEVWETDADESQVLMQSRGNLRGKRRKRSKRVLASMVSGQLYSLWQFFLKNVILVWADKWAKISPCYQFRGSREVSHMAKNFVFKMQGKQVETVFFCKRLAAFAHDLVGLTRDFMGEGDTPYVLEG
ncbi:hypothetical protein B0H14DRAFT_2578321 [Mycena olivaceomarginata]|nr:hypothetical protein B0H14DRAFT_2578321 [Mycena olivaceomarginata]